MRTGKGKMLECEWLLLPLAVSLSVPGGSGHRVLSHPRQAGARRTGVAVQPCGGSAGFYAHVHHRALICSEVPQNGPNGQI